MSAPRKFVWMFQPRFAQLVESGEKCQTIRKTPKRMPEAGDLISLREWTGKPYRSKQRILRESVITKVHVIFFTEHYFGWSFNGGNLRAIAAGGPNTSLRVENFAQADGFASWSEMCAWFKETHSLPFEGILIEWEGLE